MRQTLVHLEIHTLVSLKALFEADQCSNFKHRFHPEVFSPPPSTCPRTLYLYACYSKSQAGKFSSHQDGMGVEGYASH